MRNNTRRWMLALAVLVPLLSGCVDREVNGDVVSFSFAGWVPILVLVVGLLSAPLGFMLRNAWKKGAWLGFLIAPVLLLVVLPSMFLDYAKVDSKHFEGRYGFWMSPTKFDIRFSDLSHIKHVVYTTRGRRGRKNTNYRFDCVSMSGQVQKVSLGDLLKRAKEDVVERAIAAGVPVVEADER